MKKVTLTIVLVAIALFTFAGALFAQEVIYLGEPTIYDAPKILPRFEAPVDRDFERNPALLYLECPYEVFSDITYHGGTYRTSTSGVWGPDADGDRASGSSHSGYYLHGLGGDAGFAMKLGDTSHLAAIVSYRWGYLVGDTDFAHSISPAVVITDDVAGTLYGRWTERLNTHTYGISVLFNHAFSDAFTLGTGLTYSYNTEWLKREGAGSGVNDAVIISPEYLMIDRQTKLNYHRLAPVVGILLTPSDSFKLDVSVEAGFNFGKAGVESNLFEDSVIAVPTNFYSDDAETTDLFGWDIAAKVRPTVMLSDKLSMPFVLDFNYRYLDWNAGGPAYGYFAPGIYGGIFQGPGTVEYRNDMQSWDITGGVGLSYDAGWATLAGMLSYTHWDYHYGYGQENLVTGATFPGLTAYAQRDNEIKDTISLGLMVSKEFSPMISAALGVRYDLGWGKRDYYTSYSSPYETAGGVELIVAGDDRDMYQDLTLTTGLTLKPAERLTIALGGMVKIPLDSLHYEMDGASSGWGAAVTPVRFPNNSLFIRDYESSGWEYGGLLTVTYEFGCPVAVPPAPVAPPIEPKLEPMSFK